MKTVLQISLTALFIWAVLINISHAQVAINVDGSSPHPSAMLDVNSDTSGFLVPRLAPWERDAISNPESGLLIFEWVNDNFWWYNGSSNEWCKMVTHLGDLQQVKTPATSVYIGKLSGEHVGLTYNYNTAVGEYSMQFYSSGAFNTAIGNTSLQGSTVPVDNTGRWNTAAGYESLKNNSSGDYNTSIGSEALMSNTTGSKNTAIGRGALYDNQTGNNNTAIGLDAGFESTGSNNVFIGYQAGYEATGDNKLYIDNGNNSAPLIFGNFSTRLVGIGSNNPDAKVDIRSSGTTEDPLRVRVGSASKLRVHAANGSVSIGTSVQGPENGLMSQGNIEPRSHKGADLGTASTAWDDVYCDDLHNVAKSFVNRTLTKEILNHPPKRDAKGEHIDNLDPNSLPEGLAHEDALLTDEITSYNYKTNYEQQLLIEKLLRENNELTALIKKLEDRVVKLEGE